jgi:hypothetical protein
MALVKFLQAEHAPYKIALMTSKQKYLKAGTYFLTTIESQGELKSTTGSITSQVTKEARINSPCIVNKINALKNTIHLDTGAEYTYKCLVLSPGLDSSVHNIPALSDYDHVLTPTQNVNILAMDSVPRFNKNFYAGWNHNLGDLVCYSPKFPYKGEGRNIKRLFLVMRFFFLGCDFYALYFEYLLRQSQYIR